MYLIYKNNKLKIYEYKTFFKKLFGLMNKKNISYGIRINNCNSIHTFFMKENIDIIGLDKNNIVIYKYENLGKNRIIKINNKINETSILELPQGYSKFIEMNNKLIIKMD